MTTQGDDYARTRVPETATVSGWRVAVTKLGAVVALPGFVAGAQIGFTYGVARGLTAIAAGGLVLTAIAAATSLVAVRTRLSTSLLIRSTFGWAGSRLVNTILATILLGWFGVTAQLFGASLAKMLSDLVGVSLPAWPWIIAGGVLMVGTTLYGFRGLQRIADVTIPALLIVLILATWRGLERISIDAIFAVPANAPPLGMAVSAIVGSLATGVVVFPDLARFARTRRDAGLAALLTFAIGMPLVLALAAVPSTATHQRDLIEILTILGLGAPAFLILVLKAWASNAGNLYGASLGLSGVFPNVSRRVLAGCGGAAGTAFALFGITDYLLPILMLLGITIPALAGIYVADHLARPHQEDAPQRAVRPAAFISWVVGITVASLTSAGSFSLTHVPAIDAIASSFLLHYSIATLLPRPAPRKPESQS